MKLHFKPRPFTQTIRFYSLLFSFLCILATVIMAVFTFTLLAHYGFPAKELLDNKLLLVGIGAIITIIIGTVFGLLTNRYLADPLKRISLASQEVASGDFTVRLPEGNHTTELDDIAVNFNRMTSELASTELMRNDFVNTFSHELKTPITSIRGYARLLLREDLSDEDRKEYASVICRQSEALASITSSILLLSRLENQQMLSGCHQFCLDEQIRKSILLLERAWEEKGLELDLDLDEILFFGQEDLLVHLWNNLLDNAIKYSNPNGTIFVKAKKSAGLVEVTVQDQGCGIDELSLGKIFGKFYQGPHALGGSGLGLPICMRIANLSGGTITVKSALGDGSAFTVSLPIMEG